MENETKSVANGMGGEIEVPVYRPRVGESANDCAKRNGLRLLGRRESPTETTPVVGCVIDSGVTYRGVAK